MPHLEPRWGDEWTLNGENFGRSRRPALRRGARLEIFGGHTRRGQGRGCHGGRSEMTRFAQQVDRFYKFVKMKIGWVIFSYLAGLMKIGRDKPELTLRH